MVFCLLLCIKFVLAEHYNLAFHRGYFRPKVKMVLVELGRIKWQCTEFESNTVFFLIFLHFKINVVSFFSYSLCQIVLSCISSNVNEPYLHIHTFFFEVWLLVFFSVLGIEHRTSHVLDKCFTAELHSPF